METGDPDAYQGDIFESVVDDTDVVFIEGIWVVPSAVTRITRKCSVNPNRLGSTLRYKCGQEIDFETTPKDLSEKLGLIFV